MSFLEKLFRKRPNPSAQESAPPPQPGVIRGYDAQGQIVEISREEFRTALLPKELQGAWDSADRLFGLVTLALELGFGAEVLDAARRLLELEPESVRAAAAHCATLLALGKQDEARARAEDWLGKHDPDATLLFFLAQAYLKLGDTSRATKHLLRSVELDPDRPDAFELYRSLARDRGGDEAELEACHDLVEATPGWRARLLVAAALLKKRDLHAALALYHEALARPTPLPAEAMTRLASDLVEAGHHQEWLDLAQTHYRPEFHGTEPGELLIKSCLSLGNDPAARDLVEALLAYQRPEWGTWLDRWLQFLDAQQRYSVPELTNQPLRLTVSPLDFPLWARPREGFDQLLPAKATEALRVGIVAPSVKFGGALQPGEDAGTRANLGGFVSRGLALYLAEQLHLATTARGVALFLRREGDRGFTLSETPYDPALVCDMAGKGSSACQLVLSGHFDVAGGIWSGVFTLSELPSGKTLQRIEMAFQATKPFVPFHNLAQALCQLVAKLAGARLQAMPAWAALTEEAPFGPQLYARAQVLQALNLARDPQKSFTSITGRLIVEHLLQHALQRPADPVARMLLLTALSVHRDAGSSLYLEYGERLGRLLQEHPLAGPAGQAVNAVAMALYAPAG
jgi:tetratricopeptide (TPR) repeat protein